MQSKVQVLGDFVSLVSGNTPSKANSAYWNGTTPWVSAKDMADFWIEDSEDHLTEAGVAVASRVVPAGSVLLLTRGMTLHKRVPICRVAAPSTFNQDVKAVLPKDSISPRFLPYLLVGNHDRLHERVDSAGHGTGRLNTDALLSLPVYVPAKSEQEHIADFAEAIDDRLRLLRQTNATLESIAQALFKSWFIDFDPVRAKAQGRELDGMDAETAALFPDSLETSAVGQIPKGWHAITLGEAFELNPSRSLKKGEDAAYLEMANAPTTGHRPLEHVGTRPFGSGCKFRNGDALLAKITPCLENGKSAFVDFLGENEVGWGSTEFIVLHSRPKFPTYCAYLLARHEPFRQFAIQAMTGTSGRQRIDLSRLMQYPLAAPPDERIAVATEAVFGNIQARIAANDNQAKTLAALRDSLLPGLISGKLRLPEAEAQLNEALA
ncbi:restriction endonuclease subunit S [Burkholderia multivorans]|uniref:restriction endonuclease subunit S n=1 Tax=Burkholderia multivorans TaxID=87883 RepID=UPI001C23A764|nr:restriction endonuclease subunit S [Burkholderia multivorans]MBU9371591.1 restriction endonuclease subunit S [Burkholderia multivorans]MBU9412854.1 restriction endonuclease subunit S [Burkholderia multivorans]UXZ82809.1 restriction endonuclease subunit S [Burkholderia multivorans]